MPCDQEWLCQLLKTFGYTYAIGKGRCFGVAAMAMQAFLAHQLDSLNSRIHHLYQLSLLSEENIHILIQGKRMDAVIDGYQETIMDVHAFFDGIELYQYPAGYQEIFQIKFIAERCTTRSLSIVRPVTLDFNSPIFCKVSCGVYNQQQLIDYLLQLQIHLTVRASLILCSSNHAINLSFDPEEKKWFLLDANYLLFLLEKHFNCDQIDKLARVIMYCFNLNNAHEYTIFSTNFFVCKNDVTLFNQNDQALQQSKKWQEIHHITPETIVKHDAFNNYLLFTAVKYGDHATVKALIKAGADPNSTNINGDTILYLAIQYKQIEMVKILLERGINANPNSIDCDYYTPLHHAVLREQVAIVRALLNVSGININCKDKQGRTPLHFAIWNAHAEMIIILLEAGANLDSNDTSDEISLPFLFSEYQKKEITIAASKIKDAVFSINQIIQMHALLQLLKTFKAQNIALLKDSIQAKERIDRLSQQSSSCFFTGSVSLKKNQEGSFEHQTHDALESAKECEDLTNNQY